jgi:small subunit ribosomal protein S20
VEIVPNIKSAKKRVKVAKKKTLINQMHKTALKTAIKKAEAAIESGDKEASKVAFNEAVKKLDQSVSHGILHKNTVARKKSQLALKLAKLG